MSTTANITQSRICIERLLPHESHIINNLHDTSNSPNHFNKLKAAFYTQKIWPKDSIIKVSFTTTQNDSSWTPLILLKNMRNNDGNYIKLDPIEEEIRKLPIVDAVKKVIKDRIQPIVGLKFVFVDDDGDVKVTFDPTGGSNSLVGTDCLKSNEKSTLNFGWLDAGTIIHEFMHVIGMVHEHQNPKGSNIKWNEPKVYEWAKKTQGWDRNTTYTNIIKKYSVNQLNDSEFDQYSIMLYFFPSSLTLNHKGTQANHRLSKEDVIYINKIYPGGSMTPTVFYKNIYNEPLYNTHFNWKIILYIILGIISLFELYKIASMLIFKNKNNNSFEQLRHNTRVITTKFNF